MFLNIWVYPRGIWIRQIGWGALILLVIVMGVWYAKEVSFSPVAGIGWGIIFCLELWSVWSTPVWVVDPVRLWVSRRVFVKTERWSFQDVKFLFWYVEQKDWRGKRSFSYLFGIELKGSPCVVGIIQEKEYAQLKEIAHHCQIAMEVRHETS
ncbi:MAG: hypothetical protein N2314_07555 [Brevinematales bacterium]|nr:hypothetical protein [Brevinematales bacterium]